MNKRDGRPIGKGKRSIVGSRIRYTKFRPFRGKQKKSSLEMIRTQRTGRTWSAQAHDVVFNKKLKTPRIEIENQISNCQTPALISEA